MQRKHQIPVVLDELRHLLGFPEESKAIICNLDRLEPSFPLPSQETYDFPTSPIHSSSSTAII